MDAELQRLVRDRSGGRCEYCRLPEAESLVPFEIEHIIPRKHRGRTVAGNWNSVFSLASSGFGLWMRISAKSKKAAVLERAGNPRVAG